MNVSATRRYALLVAGVLAVAAVLRFWQLAVRPGFEWDETVYAGIGANLVQHGLLEAKTEYGRLPEPYLYHPPFYFLLLSIWFKIFGPGIPSARALAVVGSLLLLGLLAALLRKLLTNAAALAVVALLAVDGWMVFSNRISWIENTMMPLGVVALWLYWRATCRPSYQRFVIAGAVLGLLTVYKHIAIYFVLAAALHWLIIRRDHIKHAALMATVAATIVAYVVGMAAWFGRSFWHESGVQLARSLNLRTSRGGLNSLSHVVNPLLDQYKMFWLTVLMVAAAIVVLLVRACQIIARRSLSPVAGRELLFAWAAAATIYFSALQLRIPHYFLMIIVPTYCYLAAEVTVWALAARPRHSRYHRAGFRTAIGTAMAGVAMLCGLGVFWLRIVAQNDNALQQTATWTNTHLPANAEVIAEESVGALISQPYCKIYRADQCTSARFLIVYESHTLHPPDNVTVKYAMAAGSKLAAFTGFKERITVYQISQPAGDVARVPPRTERHRRGTSPGAHTITGTVGTAMEEGR